ncbi:MAG: helix-turn-helix domain-containing protein [candidate division KSB1 bacterium]|nr:helix-turn-helix domain-containing protein [candidate division KSB1 bacterium]
MEAEKKLIELVLKRANNNMKYAAEMLDVSRGTLYSKCEKLKINR